MVTGDSEGGRLPSLWRSRSSSSEVHRKDDLPVGEKPRAKRRKMMVMNDDDKYNDHQLISLRSFVELGGANTTTNH